MNNNGNIGNSSSGNTKRTTPSKRWCFTLNNYTEKEYTDIIGIFGNNKYIIGKEIGKEGTPHLQGYVDFSTKKRPLEIVGLTKRIHWEKAKGSEDDNLTYCAKDLSFVIHNMKIKKPLKILKEEQLYKWQKDIVEIVKTEPDDRTIYWFWEPKGNTGKTTFMKYLMAKYGAVPIEGKKNDILYCAAEFESDIYIFDFERSMEEYVSYAAMEKIKNGAYMCSKYESKPILRNSPHIICFANFEPDKEKLSLDRWIISRLN